MGIRLKAAAALVGVAALIGAAQAAPVTYEITFTQTWQAHDPAEPGYGWLGQRLLVGELTIDDSVLGPSNANANYGPGASELAAIDSYTVTLDGKVYYFDQSFAQTLISTDANGVIDDIRGAFRLPSTISVIYLGLAGYEGTYLDLQQTDPFNNVVVSSGTYTVSPSAIPEPQTLALVLLALGIVAGTRRWGT